MFTLSRIQFKHPYLNRIILLFYVFFSFFAHTKCIYEDIIIDINDTHYVLIPKGDKFKQMFMFSGLSVNMIYVSAFLTTSRTEFLMVTITNMVLLFLGLLKEEGNLSFTHILGLTLSNHVS